MATNIKNETGVTVKNKITFASAGKAKTKNLSIKVGDICELKITALGPNNIGMDEFSLPYPVFVPNAKYGSKIRAKIVKIIGNSLPSKGTPSSSFGTIRRPFGEGNEVKSYAVAQLISGSEIKQTKLSDTLEKLPAKAGDLLTVSIKKKGSFGLVELENNFRLIVPLSVSSPLPSYENVKIMVTRIKKEYGFAKIELSNYTSSGPEEPAGSYRLPSKGGTGKDGSPPQGATQKHPSFAKNIVPSEYGGAKPQIPVALLSSALSSREQSLENSQTSNLSMKTVPLFEGEHCESPKINLGAKLTTILPLNGKIYGKYIVFKVENTILFVKLEKGINLGDKVRIKITSTSSSSSSVGSSASFRGTAGPINNFASGTNISSAVGKILQIPSLAPIRTFPSFSETEIKGTEKGLPVLLSSSKIQKASLVMKSIREMVSHGMHFGEKAVKCHARMKNYIWLKTDKTAFGPLLSKKRGLRASSRPGGWQEQLELEHKNAALIFAPITPILGSEEGPQLQVSSSSVVGLPTLVPGGNNEPFGPGSKSDNGVKVSAKKGSRPVNNGTESDIQVSSSGAPTVKPVSKQKLRRPLIKKGRHIINLLKTRRCLNQALNKLTKYALKGRTFLFIGTKKSASGLIARASFFTKNSFYVNTRWLGGMLTNWKTICKSISKIRPILKEKQKVVRDILERRQIIKSRLIKKALLLRKKSKLILTKGRSLLEALKKATQNGSLSPGKTFSPSVGGFRHPLLTNGLLDGNNDSSKNNYMTLRDEFVTRGMNLLEKRQKFIQKRRELILQTFLVKEKGTQISLKQKAIFNQLAIYAKKLREYKYLLVLTSEIQNLSLSSSVMSQGRDSLLTDGVFGGLTTGAHNGNRTEGEALSSKNLVSVSYNKLKEVSMSTSLATSLQYGGKEQQENQSWIIPNPPKEILNKIVLTMKNQSLHLASLGLGDLKMASSIDGNTQRVVPPFGQQTPLVLFSSETEKSGDKIASIKSSSPEGKGKQIIVCSTLLSKFSRFSSYIKSVIQQLIGYIQILEVQSKTYSIELNKIQATLKTYLSLKHIYVTELQQFKIKLTNERSIIRIVKRQLKALDAQKKFIKFLPRLRYLPTPQTKISEIVQILLSKIVDPKFKYPIENIYDQKLSNTSKKLAAARKKKWQRLEKYFGGIANMTKLTKSQISRNVAIIIGQKEEMNAVRECQKLGIKMFTVVDTNCNPTLSDHIIPANDDSRSSIKYILTKFITRIRLAQKIRSRLNLYLVPPIFNNKNKTSNLMKEKRNSYQK